MKEIKFLLKSAYIVFYTSLFWIGILTDWLVTPNNPSQDPALLVWVILTMIHIIMAINYVCKHWEEEDKVGKRIIKI
jgi:hypothetical protein